MTRARRHPTIYSNGHHREDDLQFVPLFKSVSDNVSDARELLKAASPTKADLDAVFSRIAKDIEEAHS